MEYSPFFVKNRCFVFLCKHNLWSLVYNFEKCLGNTAFLIVSNDAMFLLMPSLNAPGHGARVVPRYS